MTALELALEKRARRGAARTGCSLEEARVAVRGAVEQKAEAAREAEDAFRARHPDWGPASSRPRPRTNTVLLAVLALAAGAPLGARP